MNSKWLDVRESVLPILRLLTVLVVLAALARTGIFVYNQIDIGTTWDQIASSILSGVSGSAYYGSVILALTWIVTLYGIKNEEMIKDSWPVTKEEAVSLLKKLSVFIGLFQLLSIVPILYRQIDNGIGWVETLSVFVDGLPTAAYYGGTVLALAWIVSLMGKQRVVEVRNKWLDIRESAVSLLKFMAALIIFFSLLSVLIGGYLGIRNDHIPITYWLSQSFWVIQTSIFRGCTLFALAWLVSMIGRPDAKESSDLR